MSQSSARWSVSLGFASRVALDFERGAAHLLVCCCPCCELLLLLVHLLMVAILTAVRASSAEATLVGWRVARSAKVALLGVVAPSLLLSGHVRLMLLLRAHLT